MLKNKDMRLATLLKDDISFKRRIESIAEEVKKDNVKIRNIATAYNNRYEKEIVEGTAKKHLLLEEGRKKGKSVEEIEQSSGFIPSIYTPILNWLYFFILEGRDLDQEYLRESEDEEQRVLLHEEIDSLERAPDIETYIYGNITAQKFQTLKKLKRLSKSPNEHEAFAAYRKCLELCKEYKLEFDRIPT